MCILSVLVRLDTSDCQSDSENEAEGRDGSEVNSEWVGPSGVSNANGTGSIGSASTAHDHPLAALQDKLKELNTAYDLVVKNSHQLSKFVSDLETGASKTNAGKPKETFTLMKITSAAMVKVSGSSVLTGDGINFFVCAFSGS